MRYKATYPTLLILTLLLAGISTAVAEHPAPALFHDDVNVAWRTAQESQRPLLLFVTTDGCYYCEKMLHTTYEDATVTRQLGATFVAAMVEYDREPVLARRLGVRAFPTTIIIDAQGNVRDSIRGYVKPDQLRARMLAATRPAPITRP